MNGGFSRWWRVVGVLMLLGFGVGSRCEAAEPPAPLVIAAVAPVTGPGATNGADMLDGIRIAVDKVNNIGGISGRKIDLKIYDDAASPQQAVAIANQIAARPDVLAVLGHFHSPTCMATKDIYSAAGIPVITASATSDALTEEHNSLFQATFTNGTQASTIVQYIRFVLGGTQATIVSSDDSFGKTLADDILLQASTVGLTIDHQYRIDDAHVATGDDTVINAINADRDARLVIVAALPEIAADVVAGLNYPGSKLRIIGPNSLANPIFLNTLKNYPLEALKPGYYSDNVLMVSSLIPELAPPSSLPFRNAFSSRYGREPSYSADAYYDATALVLSSLVAIIPPASQPPRDIRTVRERLLAALNHTGDQSVPNEGVLGPLVFNDHRSFTRLPPIGQFKGQRISAAPVQFTPIRDIQRVPNLAEKLESGKIVHVSNTFEWITSVVFVAVEFNSLRNIDIKDDVFDADLTVAFRFSGTFDPANIEFTNAIGPVTFGLPILERHEGDSIIRAYRVNARFRGDYELADYPFDTQTLHVTLRHKFLGEDELRLVPDLRNMHLSGGLALGDRLRENNLMAALEWELKSADIITQTLLTRTSVGVATSATHGDALASSGISVSLVLKRNRELFMLRNALFLFLISVIVLSTYFVSPDNIGPRMGAGVTSCLTTAVVHSKLGAELPAIGTLVAIEYSFYLLYAQVILSIIVTLLVNYRQTVPSYVWRMRWIGVFLHVLSCIGAISCYYYFFYWQG